MTIPPTAEHELTPVYLIIGAAGGIGTALTSRLSHRRDAHLVLAGRQQGRLEEQASRLDHPNVHIRTVDACDFQAMDQMLREITDLGSHLGGVVNLAGSLHLKPAHVTTPDEWREVIDLNLTTAFATVRATAAAVTRWVRGNRDRENPGTSVVLMSSTAARTGISSHEAIAAAKAGVIGLTRSAAATYISQGIRVNAVAPGLTQTPLTEPVTKSERARETSRSMHPLGRLGEPGDIASLIDWLLDPANSWITGETFGVDGGLASLTARNVGG